MNKPLKGMDWNVIQFPVQPRMIKQPKPAYTASQVIGMLGLLLVQMNVLAAVFGVFQTGNHIPVTGLLYIMAACLCFLYNCIKEKLWLYTACNAGTFVGNGIILAYVLMKG